MKLIALTIAALALTFTAHAAPGHGGGGFGRGGGHMGGHPGGGHWGGGHGGGHIGGGHHGGGRWGGGVWYPTYPRYHSCGWDGWYCNDTYVSGGVDCAPEQVEGNVAVTEKTLNALAATPEFATAKTFKSELKQVAAIKDAGEKAQAYLQLAGIDSNDKAAVAAFIGSRDAKGAWVTDLQRNADLSNAQAEAVSLKLQSALRGNLQ
jgi:hypothetical protein